MRRRTTLAAAAGFAVVATFAVATPAARAAAPPPAQQWTEVQALLGGIRGVWTAQDYAGAVSRNMPNTALLGNGDIGVTSGGGDGFNTGSVTDRTIASVDLNTDAALRGTWTTILQRLAPIPTTVHNGRTVYALGDAGTFSGGDTRPIHPGDNTVNLEFIHPGEALGIRSPAADRQRAIDTVNAMNSWWQDNSFPKGRRAVTPASSTCGRRTRSWSRRAAKVDRCGMSTSPARRVARRACSTRGRAETSWSTGSAPAP